jgi:hypothetical protein
MRTELSALGLPFVIGELGMHGDITTQTASWKPRVQGLRGPQANVANASLYPEFQGTVKLTEMSTYVDWESVSHPTEVLLSI